MTQIEQLLGEFIDAWKGGERPDVEAYLQRVPEAERDAFAEQLMTWLSVAPAPAYDEATRERIAADPAVRAAVAELGAAAQPLPARIHALRERAGLSIADLARAVAEAFGLSAQEARTTGYLERLEGGELDATRLSRRLCAALAGLLGVDADALAPPRAWSPATAGAAQALWRADGQPAAGVADALEALSQAAMEPAPPPMDELDRLFLGGPDA
ncbi:MAG TPA: helix-turn-helix transcriptional regulator [Myxococcota bacterium]|nr:helix-turn-helix transcriptional regulator [Myxococcota bacterium]